MLQTTYRITRPSRLSMTTATVSTPTINSPRNSSFPSASKRSSPSSTALPPPQKMAAASISMVMNRNGHIPSPKRIGAMNLCPNHTSSTPGIATKECPIFPLLDCSFEELEDAMQRSHRAAHFLHDPVDTWRGYQVCGSWYGGFLLHGLKIIQFTTGVDGRLPPTT